MNREELLSRIYENMNTAKRVMHGRMHVLIGDYPISHSQMELLFTLKHLQSERPSSKELSTHMHLTPGAISQLIEGLVSQDLLIREVNPDDRRTQTLKLSTAGLAAIQSIQKRRHEVMKLIMQGLTTDELHLLLKIQEKLTEQLTYIDKTTK